MQALDVRQLRDSLPEAIWYLHAQPPLFNALIGVVLQAPENAQQTIFTVLYSAVALTGILCFHQVAIVPITGIPVLDDEFKAVRGNPFNADGRNANYNNIIYLNYRTTNSVR
jgi:hypothetical protein